jgi:tungstate transport system permease protein
VDLIVAGAAQAARLLLAGDAEVFAILWLSLQVSGAATLISLTLGVPAGAALALLRFRGRTAAISLVNAGMGLPPVVVGLFVTLLLWRSGPMGGWEMLYTPAAIVLA